jgi:GNAT superfamily N-acetyltransferase
MEPIPGEPPAGYTLRELPKEEWMAVYPLELALNKHYRQSPFFMNRAQNTPEEFLTESTLQNARYFAAMQGDALCAYLKITFEGETFVAQGEGYCHVHGAYCLPAHRGSGLYRALLGYAAACLRKDGCTRLGVDFESINPNAWGFWHKDFGVYTHSVVRRIDERILES